MATEMPQDVEVEVVAPEEQQAAVEQAKEKGEGEETGVAAVAPEERADAAQEKVDDVGVSMEVDAEQEKVADPEVQAERAEEKFDGEPMDVAAPTEASAGTEQNKIAAPEEQVALEPLDEKMKVDAEQENSTISEAQVEKAEENVDGEQMEEMKVEAAAQAGTEKKDEKVEAPGRSTEVDAEQDETMVAETSAAAEQEDVAGEQEKKTNEAKTPAIEAPVSVISLMIKYQHLVPKKPLTALPLFSEQKAQREKAVEALKAAGKAVSHRSLRDKLSEFWKACSLDERRPFQESALKAQIEFLSEQRAWQASPECAEIEQAKRIQEEQDRRKEVMREAEEAAQSAKRAEAAQQALADAKAEMSRARVTPQKRPAPLALSPAAESAQKAKRPATAARPTSATRPTAAAATVKKDAAAKAPVAKLGSKLSDQAVLAARKVGLEEALRNLAARPEVAKSGKTGEQILSALQAAGGLVNPAKRALLGE